MSLIRARLLIRASQYFVYPFIIPDDAKKRFSGRKIKGFHVFQNENYANQPVIPNE